MRHLFFAVLAAVSIVVPAQADSPQCEPIDTTDSPSGVRVPVSVGISTEGLNFEPGGFASFIVEIGVDPSEIDTRFTVMKNDVLGAWKCDTLTNSNATRVKLGTTPFNGGLGSRIELSRQSVVARVSFETYIGGVRYIGIWQKRGRELGVLLKRQ